MARPYIDLIKKALAQVEQGYFDLPTTYNQDGIHRERVFCYELYHQMRLLMAQANTQLLPVIHGEIDKRGHADFGQNQVNPDFVFHTPGTHDNNTLVIEVKGRLVPKDIEIDFNTLLSFVHYHHYQAGVFILYCHSFEELMQSRVGNKLKALSSDACANRIHILTIKTVGQPCTETLLSKVAST
jgi:hypothetical protein